MAKVEFPRHLNRPRVLIAIEIDTVIVTTVSFVLVYIATTLAAMPVLITLAASLGIGFVAMKMYLEFKEEAPRGFLRHLLYEFGIYKVKEDPADFPELKHIKDLESVIPDGFIEELRD